MTSMVNNNKAEQLKLEQQHGQVEVETGAAARPLS
jgi:hypothetical protein